MITVPGSDEFEDFPAPPETTAPAWHYLQALPQTLASARDTIAAFRAALERGDAELEERFNQDEPVDALVRDRARLVDILLIRAWDLHVGAHAHELALIAVGGYGRGELHQIGRA